MKSTTNNQIYEIKKTINSGNYSLGKDDSAFLLEQSSLGNLEANVVIGITILNQTKNAITDQLAFEYIANAAQAGFVPAMIFLANLYLSGTGCIANYSKSLYWVDKYIENNPSFYELRIFPYMLQWFEFRRNFQISFNGKVFKMTEPELESLNLWHLNCKKNTYEKQIATFKSKKDPHETKSRLPYNGAIGGGFIKIAGSEYLEHLTFEDTATKSSHSFSLQKLGFSCNELPELANLETLSFGASTDFPALAQETCLEIRRHLELRKKTEQKASFLECIFKKSINRAKKLAFNKSKILDSAHPYKYALFFAYTSVGCFGHLEDGAGRKVVTFDYT